MASTRILGSVFINELAIIVHKLRLGVTQEDMERHITIRGNAKATHMALCKIIESRTGIASDFRRVGGYRYWDKRYWHMRASHQNRGSRMQHLQLPIN